MIPKKPAPDLIRGGYRFSEKIMRKQTGGRAAATNRGCVLARSCGKPKTTSSSRDLGEAGSAG